MTTKIKKYFNNLKTLAQSIEMLNSEELRGVFATLENETFDIDVLEMSEKEEENLKSMYELSVMITNISNFEAIFPAHTIKAVLNVKKQLTPLFQDATEYLSTEPNKTFLSDSIKQAKEGKLKTVDWL